VLTNALKIVWSYKLVCMCTEGDSLLVRTGLGLVIGLGIGINCMHLWLWWILAMADQSLTKFGVLPLRTSDQSHTKCLLLIDK